MNKKILTLSLVAVVILVLVSFTGVVGYHQTTKSSTIARASPLFSVRSKRAIDEESKDLTCDYIGKGEVNNIYLPERNDKTDSVDTLINVIKRMDDKSLQKFTYFIKYRLQQTDSTPDFDRKDIFQLLKQLRDNPVSVILYTEKEKFDTAANSVCIHFSIDIFPPFFCLLYYLVGFIYYIIASIAEYLTIYPIACPP